MKLTGTLWSILEKLSITDTDEVIADQKANWKAVQLRQDSSDVIYVSDDNREDHSKETIKEPHSAHEGLRNLFVKFVDIFHTIK